MKIDIRSLPQYHVASIRHLGPYEGIGTCFSRLFAWAGPGGHVGPGSTTLGVYHDDPATIPPADFRSDACVTVRPGIEVPEGIVLQTLPAGEFAVWRTEVFNNAFGEAWHRFLSEGLPGCGRTPVTGACYEIYHNNAMTDPDRKWILDLCAPVAAS